MMRIDGYLNRTMGEVAWWQNRLDQEEYADVHRGWVAAGGEVGLDQFDDENSPAIEQLLEGTVVAREKYLQTLDGPGLRNCALLCCLRRAKLAHLWLEQAHAQIERLEWSKPSRKTPAEAASGATQFLESLPFYWPYEVDED